MNHIPFHSYVKHVLTVKHCVLLMLVSPTQTHCTFKFIDVQLLL